MKFDAVFVQVVVVEFATNPVNIYYLLNLVYRNSTKLFVMQWTKSETGIETTWARWHWRQTRYVHHVVLTSATTSTAFSTWCIHRMNCRAIARMFVHLSVCPSLCLGQVYIVITFSTDLSLWLASPMSWAPWHQSMSTYLRLFPVPPGRQMGYGCAN